MKLKYATKLFICVNVLTVAFRTLQIIFMTESGTQFLKDSFKVISIIGTVVSVLALALLFANCACAVRQPEKVNCRGISATVASVLSGILYLVSGILAATGQQLGWQIILILSLSVTAACVLMAVSAATERGFPKVIAIAFLVYWLAELVLSYLSYIERALRVRTVYEVLAVCFVLLFSITFGKAVSSVDSEKNFRRIYPLGLTACSLCILSVVPEVIAKILGFADKVSQSAISPVALVAAAVFTGFFTINTFKKSNTVHPKAKKRRAAGALQQPSSGSQQDFFSEL